MKCEECNSELKRDELTFATKYVCTNCGFAKVEYPRGCCNVQNTELVRYYSDEDDAMMYADNYVVYAQCQTCGKKSGNQKKKSDYKKDDLECFDYELFRQRDKKIAEDREKVKEIDDWKKEQRRDKFWDDYSTYLKSEQWLEKRELVLKRDKNICQSCLTKNATQVHHTVGYFRKNEPLFTLVSVCDKCHDIITEIERGNHKGADKITHEKT